MTRAQRLLFPPLNLWIVAWLVSAYISGDKLYLHTKLFEKLTKIENPILKKNEISSIEGGRNNDFLDLLFASPEEI